MIETIEPIGTDRDTAVATDRSHPSMSVVASKAAPYGLASFGHADCACIHRTL